MPARPRRDWPDRTDSKKEAATLSECAPAGIDTPCRKICVVDPDTDLCIGCARSRAEIAGWRDMAPGERRRIMDELPARLDQAGRQRRRKGGRRARLARAGR